MSDFLIRPAEEADIPELLEIVNYEIINTTSNYDYKPKQLQDLLDWFYQKNRENWPVLVAEGQDHILGYATYGSFRSKIAYRYSIEHSIYLRSDRRGNGIGTVLLEKLISIARDQGFHTMIAGVDAANEGSYRFHQKMGFVEVARFREVGFKFDRWLDLIFMQLFLQAQRN